MMPTIKLVVIGSSGVGKTSLRGKYISGRFSTGYRATIGADFISKTLAHPSDSTQTITLQIWDTAGQERFSSLSTAFFRGADAAILMFDVNNPSTMVSTKKWWADFCDKAPVADDDVPEFCCVLVGNKIDTGRGWSVSENEALNFLDKLVAPQEVQEGSVEVIPPEPDSVSALSNGHVQVEETDGPQSLADPTPIPIIPNFAHSRESSHSPKHHLSKSYSRSRSSSRFYAGTIASTHTALTIYHTPSSSLFDRSTSSIYQSARSSPEPWSQSSPDLTNSPRKRRRTITMLSRESTGSDSVLTMTPSLFARERDQNRENENSNGLPSSHSSPDLSLNQSKYRTPLPPDRGPRLFFTSAKTGEGVNDVFEYIASRVVRKWEYDDWLDARRMHFRDPSVSDGATIGLSEIVRLDRRIGSRSGCC